MLSTRKCAWMWRHKLIDSQAAWLGGQARTHCASRKGSNASASRHKLWVDDDVDSGALLWAVKMAGNTCALHEAKVWAIDVRRVRCCGPRCLWHMPPQALEPEVQHTI